MQKNSKKQTLNHLIIVDGALDEEELKKAHKTKSWLNSYLKRKKMTIEKISLLSVDKNDKVTLYSR